VADITLEAIYANRFYVSSNPGSRERIANHTAQLLPAFE